MPRVYDHRWTLFRKSDDNADFPPIISVTLSTAVTGEGDPVLFLSSSLLTVAIIYNFDIFIILICFYQGQFVSDHANAVLSKNYFCNSHSLHIIR
jgi:hypothetical protein